MLWHVIERTTHESYFTYLPSKTNNMSPQKIETSCHAVMGGHQCLSQQHTLHLGTSFNETKLPPMFAFQTTEEIKLYNKLVNALCTEMKSGYFDCDMLSAWNSLQPFHSARSGEGLPKCS